MQVIYLENSLNKQRIAAAPEIRSFSFFSLPDGTPAGWQPDNCQALVPGTGEAVAHYCLEHTADTKGTFGEKLIAVGRMWYLRIEPGYQAVRRREDKEDWQLLSDAIVECALGELVTAESRHLVVTDAPAEDRALFESYERTLDAALNDAALRLKSHFLGHGLAYSELTAALEQENVAAMARCVHKGFRNGRYLYLGHQESALRIFDTIAYNVDRTLSQAQPGDRLHVSYCRHNAELTVRFKPRHAETVVLAQL